MWIGSWEILRSKKWLFNLGDTIMSRKAIMGPLTRQACKGFRQVCPKNNSLSDLDIMWAHGSYYGPLAFLLIRRSYTLASEMYLLFGGPDENLTHCNPKAGNAFEILAAFRDLDLASIRT